MSDFAFLFRTNPEDRRRAMGTPEQAQRSMEAWLVWIRELETSGHLRQRGQPLDPEGSVVRGPGKVVTDGPFVESKDIVLGFLIVEARDLGEAVKLADGCPMLQGQGSVEVRPVGRVPA